MNYQLRTAYPTHMICSNLPISLYDTIELGPATMFLICFAERDEPRRNVLRLNNTDYTYPKLKVGGHWAAFAAAGRAVHRTSARLRFGSCSLSPRL